VTHARIEAYQTAKDLTGTTHLYGMLSRRRSKKRRRIKSDEK